MTLKRIDWVDAAKCIGIFLVAFGHNWLDSKFCYFIFAFHMPLFFILGGITLNYVRDFKHTVYAKAKAILLPYFFFALCIVGVYSFLSYTHNGDYDTLEQIRLFALQRRHTHLWFLPVLFFSELFVISLLKIKHFDEYKFLLILILSLFGIYFIIQAAGFNKLIWNIDLVPLASAFILIGVLFSKHKPEYLINNNKWYWGGILVLFFAISTINYLSTGMVDMAGSKFGHYPLFILGAISASFFLFFILRNVSLPNWLLYIGIYSIVFYGLHRIIIDFMFIMYGKLGIEFIKDSWSGIFLAFLNVIIAIGFLYPISKLINRYCPWVLGKF